MGDRDFVYIEGELYVKHADGSFKKSEYSQPPPYKGSIASPIIHAISTFGPQIGEIVKSPYDFIEKMNGRNDKTLLSTTCCGRITNCFTRDGQYMGASGERTGPCGTKKDNRRAYICQDCWNRGIRI
ncbi:hypothetical protein SteCoe_30841 [Stentor coeruleus]|uniref:Uncharacterized protein n=1 Tax=Stentor coeruleus TaxID=5963 RepID=A0A1R2B2N0_9CILI|nr:hypothetical protein SteCoe_30841 [Stentor coeruleus]